MAGKGQPMPNHYSTRKRSNKGDDKLNNEISSHRHPIVYSVATKTERRGVFVPFLLLDLLQDYASAILLAQIIHYTGGSKNRWFYKSSADWYEELRMSDDVVRRCLYGDKRNPNRVALVDLGVHVDRRRANGAPTKHYMINTDEMEAALARLIERRRAEGLIIEIPNNPIPDNVREPSQAMSENESGQSPGTITESYTESYKEHTAPDKPSRADGKKPTHQQAMAQAVVDAIGISNPTRSEWSRAAKVGKELEEAGVAAEDFGALVQFVRNQAAGRWTVTMTSLTTNGRVSAYLAARNKSVTRDMSSGDDGVERVTMVTYDVPFETPDWLEEHDDDNSG